MSIKNTRASDSNEPPDAATGQALAAIDYPRYWNDKIAVSIDYVDEWAQSQRG